MPKSDKDVKIRIDTEADTSGAEKEVKAVEKVTEAVEDLSDAEKERAKRKAEYEQRMATPGYSDPVNPMTDGSQLAARQQATEATKDQAEAVEDLTFKVEELSQAEQDALKAQREGDLERAKAAKRARESVEQADDGFSKLFNQQRLQGIGFLLSQLTQEAGRFAREFAASAKGKELLAGLSEETRIFGSTVAEVGTGVAQGFAIGGPIGAAVGGLKGLLTSLGTEWLATNKRIEDSNKDLADAVTNSKARMEQRARVAKDDGIRKQLAAELTEIEKQNAAIERQKKLRDALKGLAEAKDALADQRAIAGGASPEQVGIRNTGEDSAAEQADIAQALADKKAELDTLGKEVQAKANAFVEATRGLSERVAAKSEEAIALREAMARLESMTLDYEAMQQENAVRLETLKVETTTVMEGQFSQASQSIGTTVTGLANQAISDIEALSKEKGGEISRDARDILDRLRQIVKDGIPDEQQAAELQQLMGLFRSTWEGANREMFTTFGVLMDGFREASEGLQKLQAEVKTIQQQIRTRVTNQ